MRNNNFDKIVLIIPSYLPQSNLTGHVSKLQNLGFNNIIVVNDGSPKEYDPIFNSLKNVIILSHDYNFGKGAALKTAFRFILKNFTTCRFIISSDDDGQHSPDDILNIAQLALAGLNTTIYLGKRNLASNIPIKSFLGNLIIGTVKFYV